MERYAPSAKDLGRATSSRAADLENREGRGVGSEDPSFLHLDHLDRPFCTIASGISESAKNFCRRRLTLEPIRCRRRPLQYGGIPTTTGRV